MASLAITSAAALTPVGDSVEQTCTSIRAGLKRFSVHAFFETSGWDPEWDRTEPLIAATAPGIDPLREGPDRLVDLLLPVLADLARRAGLERKDLSETALLLALPERCPVTDTWGLEGDLALRIEARSGLSFARVKVSREGRPGMLSLLTEAERLFAARAVKRAIVAGADSYLTGARLAHLDRQFRIKSPRNADGFIPGEAASALLVEPAARLDPRKGPPLALVSALGRGEEPQPSTGDRQSTGKGLTAALRPVLAEPARAVGCDMNGESYRAFEWGVALSRLGDRLSSLAHLSHPAICHGDIGAATGGVLIASVIAGFTRGHALSSDAVLWAAADGPLRTAARIARPAG
ncbi:MAG: hypothetical protein R3B70_40195 [Polyangiaceae bacterium]